MIVPFWGELLFHPIPLELSFNPCSHGCLYCFNRLNVMNKHCDMVSLTNLINDYMNRDTYTAKLLQMGYPVVMSNRSDPFAASSEDQAIPIIKLMDYTGIPMAFQTKGGNRVFEAVDMLSKTTCWYISISHDQDETRKQVEPNAPDIEHRFKLIEYLRSKGHRVSVGINPFVRQWIKDIPAFVKRLKNAGCETVYVEKIHFNKKQVQNLSEAQAKRLTPEVIREALKKMADNDYIDSLLKLANIFEAVGIKVGSTAMPIYDYWRMYKEIYPVVFPNTMDFIHLCFKTMEDGSIIDFSYYKKYIVDKFPKGKFNIKNYILNKGFRFNKDYELPGLMDFEHVLKIIWSDCRHIMSIGKAFYFSRVVDKDESGVYRIAGDEQLIPYYMFNRKGFKSYEVDINGKEVR